MHVEAWGLNHSLYLPYVMHGRPSVAASFSLRPQDSLWDGAHHARLTGDVVGEILGGKVDRADWSVAPKQNHPNSRCQLARGTMGLGAYLRAPTPRDSRSVPSDRAKCHFDRAVRPLRFSRRRPRRADHHRHPGSVGWRGPMHGGCRPNAWDSASSH